MKIIITESQYKSLVTSLLDILLGDITIKTVKEKKEEGDKSDHHSIFDEYGDLVMTIWVKGKIRNRGCKKDLTLESSILEQFERYMPYYRHKIFSKVLVEYVYDKFGIKCDCVQYDYGYEQKTHVDDDGDEYDHTEYKTKKYNVKKKKKIKESVKKSNIVDQLLELENIKIDFEYIDGRVLDDNELEEYFGTTVIDDDEIEDSLGGSGAKIYNREVYVHFYINNKLVSSPSIYFITKNNKVIGVSSHNRFTDIATSFRYIPYKILNSYFIEKAKTYLEGVLSDGNNLNESANERSNLENIIYSFLQDDFYPDYNWGPELFDFYREDVEEHGMIPFYINDSEGYVYYDDGTLEIMPWVCKKLDEYFNDSWYSVFKDWFEENSGLIVSRIVDSRNNGVMLGESIDKNKKLINSIVGFDFSGRIEQITSTHDIANWIDECVGWESIRRRLNNFGPMYTFELDGVKYLYQDRGKFELFMDDDCNDYFNDEIHERLGIDLLGLKFSDIINMYFEEEES